MDMPSRSIHVPLPSTLTPMSTVKPVPYCEIVRERFMGQVIASDIHPATEAEIALAQSLHLQGKCPHNIVIDEPGWLYDFRSCYTCEAGLGAI